MTEIGFDGKVAIVTGAGGGLGRQHALELASRGARLVINDLGGSVNGEGNDVGPAQKVVQEIEDLGGEAVADTNSVATAGGRPGRRAVPPSMPSARWTSWSTTLASCATSRSTASTRP